MEEIFVKETVVLAKDYFKRVWKIFDLAISLSKEFPEVSYLICVTHIEGLAKLKYPKTKGNYDRFKKVIENYGNQTEEFNRSYLDRLWKFYRCHLVHEWCIIYQFLENNQKEDHGFLRLIENPTETEILNHPELKYIKTSKILEITKHCLENLEKEFDPTDTSKIIHRIRLDKKRDEELEYQR